MIELTMKTNCHIRIDYVITRSAATLLGMQLVMDCASKWKGKHAM